MHKRHAISTTGRSRFLVAAAVLALLASIPAATVGAVSSPSAAVPAAGSAGSGVSTAAAQPAGSQTNRPAARPTPDQVALVDHSGAGTGARLILSAPKSVAVGQTITVALKASGVKNLAGYQGVLRFDPSAAEFDGLTQRTVALAGSGRDVQPLGPVEVPAGVAFGLYSCPIAGCGDGGESANATKAPGASGNVPLAKFTLLPTVAGNLSIALGSLRFVDANGKPMTLTTPGTITVKVGAGGSAYAAPAALAEVPGTAQPVTDVDLSGDGVVGPADLNLAAVAWAQDQGDGTSCALVNEPADVNHDGCLDVSDLQAIAAQVAPRPAAPPLTGRFAEPDAALVLVVNSTADTSDKTPGDGICATAANVCTLRAAIQEANLNNGPDTIDFNIAGAGVHTITLSGTLPTITDTTGGVTIDGYSQPGASPNTDPVVDNAVIEIQITSSAANNCQANPVSPHYACDGMVVTSANNVIRGISMYNLRRSITFETISATANSVVGSFIGTNAAGTFFSPDFVSGANGINVTEGASATVVGGPNPADRDVISGNAANGFSTYNEQSDHNILQGDIVGLAPNGQQLRTCTGTCYGQISHGVDINTGSSYNLIGGSNPGDRNVISNNRGEGVEFSHSTTTDSNQAIGNYIGTDVTGNAGAANKFGNGLNGVHLEDGVTGSVIAFNVIDNNAQRADGSEYMGGIGIEGFYTAGNSVHDNMIGVGADGTTPLPNNFFGINVHFNASWTTVGPNNIIANNPTGVIISDVSDIDNTVTQNSIFNNGSGGTGRGIQVINGSNNGIGVPTLSPSGVSLTAANGAACAGCTVEVFKASTDAGDASSGTAGQGKVFLGSTLVPVSGAFTVGFNQTLGNGDPVTASVTDATGNTSQFSLNVAAASVGQPTPPPTPAPTPPPTVTTYASDTFNRTLSQTWGPADVGGNYAAFYCTNDDMNVTGSVGTVVLPDPNHPEVCPKDSTNDTVYRGGYLTNVSAQDVDVRFRVASSTLASGDNINVGFDARRVSGFTSYRGQVRFTPSTNQVWLQADTVLNGVMTGLGTNTHAGGVTVTPGGFIWVRAQITGTNPTTIQMKAWNDGQPEPTAWAYTTTNATPVLQAPGAVGLVSWLSGAWTGATPTISFDDFNVTSPLGVTVPAPPVADFTSSQLAGTLEMDFTDTSTGGAPDSWFWDFGDGQSSTTQNPSNTYANPGTYTVKLITTNDGGSTSKSIPVVVSSTVAGIPTASFTKTQTFGTLKVNFTDTSSQTPTSWHWDFGDGHTSSSQNPSHTYSAPGPYAVTLDATNDNGTGTVSQGITVNPLPLPGATYHTVTPNRLVDTRKAQGISSKLTTKVARTFRVTGLFPTDASMNIPDSAVAVTGNLTVTGQTSAGYLALTPVATNSPTTSTLNFPLNDTRANGVTAPLGTGSGGHGYLSVTYMGNKGGSTTQVVFDVTGYFAVNSTGATYHSITSNRIVDTRTPLGLPARLKANISQTFAVAGTGSTPAGTAIPLDATGITGNLTVTGQSAAGYFTLAPNVRGDDTSAPTTSTLNFPVGDTRANGVTLPLGPGGTLTVTYLAKAGATAQVVFDVTGYFSPDTTGAKYVTVAPTRILDSRFNNPPGQKKLLAGQGQTFPVIGDGSLIPITATAVTGNLTVTGQTWSGYFSLTTIATNTPTTSTLNFPKGDTRANGVTMPLNLPDGTLGVTYMAKAGASAQVVFDVTGYFTP